MPDDPHPPVAIRITRPYATEDDFLDKELETLTRTSVVLLGTQSRPQGVVLRFELALASGHVLVRGEGRVVGFKPNVVDGMGGLTLRFTRLDTRSKALVDKATALREQRKPSTRPPPTSSHPPPPASPIPTPAPPASPALVPAPAFTPAFTPAPALAPAPTPAPAGRDSLLDRLRTRARSLDAASVSRILDRRREG